MFKKTLAAAAAVAMALTLSACSSDDKGDTDAPGRVYFLNFKPEVAEIYEEIAAAYTAETGVEVKVVTAASGTYEQTLTSEIAKSEPPTIFQINGPVGYADWKDYTADIKGSDLYKHLADPSLAIVGADGGVYGVPYVVEGYGIIFNDAIMRKYFLLPGRAVTDISSAAEITTFEQLKAVVEDMTKFKVELGITGVFASTSLKPGEDWRWQTHLADVPLYYEFEDSNYDLSAGTPAEVQFSYGPNYQQLFDLYLQNSTTEPGMLGSRTVDDSMAEFALGQAAMVQNGNWGWGQISGQEGNVVLAEDVHFMPLYIGVEGEANQGICIGTENYFSINKEVSAADQQASLDFLYWLFSSETGKKFVTEDLGFITPFDTFTDAEGPTDPLAKEVVAWMGRDGVTSVPWVFSVMPGQQFKNDFGAALLEYAQGKADWATVTSTFVDSWKTQAEAGGE